MMRNARLILVAVGAALSLAACFGGKKIPPTLLTLTSSAPAPASVSRIAAPGEAITIDVPVVPKELSATRVPALAGPTAVAYIKDLLWVDAPDKLFQDLLQETTAPHHQPRRPRPAPGERSTRPQADRHADPLRL